MRHVTFVRWLGRVTSVPILLLFGILFVQDGFPVFLFGTDPSHMIALVVSLLGLAIGWKWELAGGGLVLAGYLADLVIVNVRMGTMSLDMGPILTVVPLVGLAYLYAGWRSRSGLAGNSTAVQRPTELSGGGPTDVGSSVEAPAERVEQNA